MNETQLLIKEQKRNRYIMISLDVLLVVLAISVVYNGLSPCDKCKLEVSKKGFNQTLSCTDLAYHYINSTGLLDTEPIMHEPFNTTKLNITFIK